MANLKPEQYPFSFINGLGSLQSIASTNVAFNLWHHRFYPHFQRYPDDTSFWETGFSCGEILNVPSYIQDMIDEKIKRIRVHLREWMEFHRNAALFNRSCRHGILKCFNGIVFNPDGSISFRRSGANLVKMDYFNNVQKYKIACTFCLEDDVRRIWPSVSRHSILLGNSCNIYFPISYWNSRMESREDHIPATDRFLLSFHAQNWAAFEYFFGMLTNDQKLGVMYAFEDILNVGFCWREKFEFTMHTLSKFNKVQARSLIQEHAGKVLSTFMVNDEYFRHMGTLWLMMKDVFNSRAAFFDIIRELWKLVYEPGDRNFIRRDRINRFLIEVWTIAPNEVKSNLTSGELNFFFDELSVYMFGFTQIYGHDMTFLLQLLNCANYETRNELWKRHWRILVLTAKPAYLDKFMKISLRNDEEMEMFKSEIANELQSVYSKIIELAMFSDLSDYLHFFSKDPKRIQELCKQIFEWNAGKIMLYDSYKFGKFEAFIDSIFSNESEDIEIFKHLVMNENQWREMALI